MKHRLFITLALFTTLFASAQVWKKEQIMPTAELAEKIKTNAKDIPIIFNVGPMENIKKAVFVGRATSATFVDQMRQNLNMVPKTRTVVVYCGCCSFTSCPNLKPAYDALIKLGYTNAKVLDLPEGIKPDWVAKGYPTEE
jgi:rhodanese-related sulfurtransferase